MASIVRPSRQVVFGELRGPIPADRLDSQIQNLIDAIHSTQMALAEIRRDDGQLRVPQQQLRERHELENLENRLLNASTAVAGAATGIKRAQRDVDLRAKDAETAAFAAVKSLAEVERQGAQAQSTFDDADNAADRSEYYAVQSQNSSNYAKAYSDGATAAKVEATQWAEYLAGPVVNANDAPAYIAGHPFGHGLYYQPVEGYGGMAGLWSAKWWAVYAAQLVGPWSFYYLGSWPQAPIPGNTNPQTGVKVPNPLAPGSFYYNTTTGQLFIWDGTQWQQPFVPVLTPGYLASYLYVATAGQTTFSGADSNGRIPDVTPDTPSDVHVNGLRLVYGTQYTVNTATNTLTLLTPATAGALVQWDLLSGQANENIGSVFLRKITLTPVPNGTVTAFTMTWNDPDLGIQPVEVTSGVQLQVTLDGIVQEPGLDYVAHSDILTMSAAPPVNSHFWAIWFVEGLVEPPPPATLPVNITPPTISGSTSQGTMLTATPGGWTGTPPPDYSYQWKSGGANVGLNQTTYVTQSSDLTKIITVEVTATNSAGFVKATSANFGPIIVGDTTPNPFTFTDQSNVALSTIITSNTITVAGIDAPSNMTITGGQYSKNGGAFASAATTVVAGDTVQVRGTSSASNSTAVNVVLTIGGVSDTFTITTLSAYKATYHIYFF